MTTITIHRPDPSALTTQAAKWNLTPEQCNAALAQAMQYALTYGFFEPLTSTYDEIEIFIQSDLELLCVYRSQGRQFVMGGIPRPENLKRNQYGGEDFKYSFHS